jgi:hypothetical protein
MHDRGCSVLKNTSVNFACVWARFITTVPAMAIDGIRHHLCQVSRWNAVIWLMVSDMIVGRLVNDHPLDMSRQVVQ